MDVYITEKATGSRIALSLLPEKIKRKSDTKFQTYNFINVGEVKLPSGINLLSFSWGSFFPGESLKKASYIKSQHWKSPKELENIIEKWRKSGTKLVLMVTETFINHEVMVQNFTSEPRGGNGDIDYDITFTESKDVFIYTTSELNIKPSVNTSTPPRPAPPAVAKRTYTVVRGDCLWSIAERFLGNGSKYPEIYNLNKTLIDKRNKGTGNPKYTIYSGQVFTLP